MAPTLTIGDYILVLKPVIGARIFNVFACMQNEQTDIYRLPGFKKIERNDVLVFNSPHPNSFDKVEMHILKYYVKRCVGLPGDTLSIRQGFFHIDSQRLLLGNMSSQQKIAAIQNIEKKITQCFPYDSIMGWDIKNFGPLYIPSRGDSIPLNSRNYRLYKELIEWEGKSLLQYRDSVILFNQKPIRGYRFQKNYYFMAGDNGLDSQDSRYWGLLPEEYIVGKAWVVWKSFNPFTGKFCWERFLKPIY